MRTRGKVATTAKKSYSMSVVECLECGHRYPLFRQTVRQKSEGHIKHVWCVICKDETAHTELPKRIAYYDF